MSGVKTMMKIRRCLDDCSDEGPVAQYFSYPSHAKLGDAMSSPDRIFCSIAGSRSTKNATVNSPIGIERSPSHTTASASRKSCIRILYTRPRTDRADIATQNGRRPC